MSIREIKGHIRTTKEIARITNVMYLLAASRIAQVRKRHTQAHRYFKEIVRLVLLADAKVKKKDISLLTWRPIRNLLYVVISPDQGFCGGLPSKINRWVTTSAQEQQNRMAQASGGKLPTVSYLAVGKKGRDYLIRTNCNLVKAFTNTQPTWALAMQIAQIIVEAFQKEEADAVFIVYAKSDLETPKLVVEQILPVSLSQISLCVATEQESGELATETKRHSTTDILYFFAPTVEVIFPQLILRYLISQLYGALLEGAISEHTARMLAMKEATRKAKESLDDLMVAFHVARQAQITTDLLEIISTAEALRLELFP